MHVTDYIEKPERQSNNKEHYRQLLKHQTAANNEKVDNVIEKFQKINLINKNVFQKENLVTKNVADGLKITSPRYIQPKTHQTGNPGRPVITSVNCYTPTISNYVDYHLQPIVQQIPFYMKDISEF